MTEGEAADGGGLAARLELQARLLELLRHDLEAARQANEAKDRSSMETWRRLRLYEMLLEESQRDRGRLQEEWKNERDRLDGERIRLEGERARLTDELLHLRSTLSWRLTAPLRGIRGRGPAAAATTAPAPQEVKPPVLQPPPPPMRVQQRSWTHLDLMEEAVGHLYNKGFRPRVVLDIGAAKGKWSQRAAGLFTEAAFYLFDPLEENEAPLRALSERDPRFHHFLTALGRRRATMTMNVAPDLYASSLLHFPGQQRMATPRPVPVDSLDALLASGQVPRPDLVKIDVQGFELEVLAGATGLFGGGCVFIVEVSLFEFMPGCPVAHEVVSYFAQRGYQVFDLAGLLRRPFQDDLGQMDLVFVPRDSPLVAGARWS